MKIPEGWPTEEMKEAFSAAYKGGSIWTDRLTCALDAMLAAAPTPPAQPDSLGPFGSPELLQQASDLCHTIERLPAGEHQTKLSSLASDLAFGMQNLQMNGDHFWPQPVVTPPAPEVEAVAVVKRMINTSIIDSTGCAVQWEDLLDGAQLYTHPANDGLRRAAESIKRAYLTGSGSVSCGLIEELCAELNNKNPSEAG